MGCGGNMIEIDHFIAMNLQRDEEEEEEEYYLRWAIRAIRDGVP